MHEASVSGPYPSLVAQPLVRVGAAMTEHETPRAEADRGLRLVLVVAGYAETVIDWLTNRSSIPSAVTEGDDERDDCSHDWTLRPESDTWVCEICGAER